MLYSLLVVLYSLLFPSSRSHFKKACGGQYLQTCRRRSTRTDFLGTAGGDDTSIGLLATLTSVGLTEKVRDIIEQGPPEELVAAFHKILDGKVKETKSAAAQAAKRYGLLPGLIE